VGKYWEARGGVEDGGRSGGWMEASRWVVDGMAGVGEIGIISHLAAPPHRTAALAAVDHSGHLS